MGLFTSVHGICYDNGQSGSCNVDCELFIGGECDAYSDVIEAETDEAIDVLAVEYIDPFRLGIIKSQTKVTFNLRDQILKIIGY